MPKVQETERKDRHCFSSFEEYKKFYYPDIFERDEIILNDPNTLGEKRALETINEVKHMFSLR